MLGLTTDESPHGLNAKNKTQVQDDDYSVKEHTEKSGSLVAQGKASGHGHGDLTVSAKGEPKKKKKKPSQDQQRQALNNHDNPNKKEGKPRTLHSISARNHAAGRDMDTLFWRALCDDPVATMDYMADDVSIVSPLFFGTSKAMTRKSKDPSLKEALESLGNFTGFRIQEVKTIEAALMAVACMSRITLGREGEDGEERFDVMVHSTWRQDAGADWYLVGQLIAEVNE